VRIDFYHLTAAPLEKVLPAIAEKVAAGGGRLVIVAEEPLLAALDRELWTWSAESFLPHGRSDGPGPEVQPILLAEAVEASNGARNVALADGKWRDEALAFERVFYFFGGDTLEAARTAWRALKGREGAELRYWKQQDGRWVEGP
jgi:DNA polymerase-3 subunit chi